MYVGTGHQVFGISTEKLRFGHTIHVLDRCGGVSHKIISPLNSSQSLRSRVVHKSYLLGNAAHGRIEENVRWATSFLEPTFLNWVSVYFRWQHLPTFFYIERFKLKLKSKIAHELSRGSMLPPHTHTRPTPLHRVLCCGDVSRLRTLMVEAEIDRVYFFIFRVYFFIFFVQRSQCLVCMEDRYNFIVVLFLQLEFCIPCRILL